MVKREGCAGNDRKSQRAAVCAKARGRKKGKCVALVHFLIELLSGNLNLHSVSGCHLLLSQINIDLLLSAFVSS